LFAEVSDLKVGLTALEERARSDLGMVGNSETFYQVVTAATPAPAAPGAAVTARAQ
jgi:cell division protein FtsB